MKANAAAATNREIMSYFMLKRIGTSEFNYKPERTIYDNSFHTPKDGVKILRAVGEPCGGKADAQGKLLVIKEAQSHSFKPKIEHGP
jgi:hypothetical protein